MKMNKFNCVIAGCAVVFAALPVAAQKEFRANYDESKVPDFELPDPLAFADGKAVVNSSQWNADIENAANRAFVADFVATYGRRPSLYASQGYDAARLIGSALAAVKGDVSDKSVFRLALTKAEFESVRGNFRFGSNHHPIQDIYVRQVYRDETGELTNKIVGKVFSDHQDAYAKDCIM